MQCRQLVIPVLNHCVIRVQLEGVNWDGKVTYESGGSNEGRCPNLVFRHCSVAGAAQQCLNIL